MGCNLRNLILIITAASFGGCKTAARDSAVKDSSFRAGDKYYLLYALANDQTQLCLSTCSMDPKSAMTSANFAACGNTGFILDELTVKPFIDQTVELQGDPKEAGQAVLSIIKASPQTSLEETGEKRPPGLMEVVRGVAGFIKSNGKSDTRCNAEQHIKDWAIYKLSGGAVPMALGKDGVDLQPINASVPPQPVQAPSAAPTTTPSQVWMGTDGGGWKKVEGNSISDPSLPKDETHYYACYAYYQHWTWRRPFRLMADNAIDGMHRISKACEAFADGKVKNCVDQVCYDVSRQTFSTPAPGMLVYGSQGPLGNIYEGGSAGQDYHKSKSGGLVNEWGFSVKIQRPRL